MVGRTVAGIELRRGSEKKLESMVVVGKWGGTNEELWPLVAARAAAIRMEEVKEKRGASVEAVRTAGVLDATAKSFASKPALKRARVSCGCARGSREITSLNTNPSNQATGE